MKCEICSKEMQSYRGLVKHIIATHKTTAQSYYDKYYKKPNDGVCLTCGKSTPFLTLQKGYQKHCCAKCGQTDPNTKNNFRVSNPQKSKEIQDKTRETCINKYGGKGFGSTTIQQKAIITRKDRYGLSNKKLNSIVSKYCKEYNLVNIETAYTLNKSCGWIDNIEIFYVCDRRLIKKSNLEYIKNYKEKELDTTPIIQAIKEVYSGEIDEDNLYLPELNVTISYKSNYSIAIESGKDKDYILNQSLEYKQKNCRLIHIFEFEDLDHQLYLLKEFLKGNDLYENDFSKNNLLDIDAKSKLAYVDANITIYSC